MSCLCPGDYKSVRPGMTIRIIARGPIIVPLPSGDGPFDFIDFRDPTGGAFHRLSVEDGAPKHKQGTGMNFVEYIDLVKPDQSAAVRFMIGTNQGFRSVGDGSLVGAREFIAFKSGSSVFRIKARNDGSYYLEQQS